MNTEIEIMQIDFDKLRKRIGNQYNALCLLCGDIKNAELKLQIGNVLAHMHDSIATLLCCESENQKIQAIDFKLLPYDENK
jgi:predicted nuclease of predicted toxin-antitoxin system